MARSGNGNPEDRSRTGRDSPKGQSGHGHFKEFWLTSFAVDHPTSVIALTVIVIIMGLISYIRVPKEAAPEIKIPVVAVNTVYSGVAPNISGGSNNR